MNEHKKVYQLACLAQEKHQKLHELMYGKDIKAYEEEYERCEKKNFIQLK